ncbi:hypothetical protein [uncultured Mediterranean phage uvMED]|nr:hypothetical protein [uncultured Mediterranean phage uvMED]
MSDDKLVLTINDFKKALKGKTVRIHNNEYATVALRVGILRRNLGTAATIASTIEHQDEKRVIVKAQVFIDQKLVATGLAEELRAASRINQTSALEVAETSAVGRALAFLALTNDNIASAEEISGAIVQSDQKLTAALTELDKVSHLGAYNEWLSSNKELMQKVKQEDAYAWQMFLEKFNQIRKNLETKGVIQNG